MKEEVLPTPTSQRRHTLGMPPSSAGMTRSATTSGGNSRTGSRSRTTLTRGHWIRRHCHPECLLLIFLVGMAGFLLVVNLRLVDLEGKLASSDVSESRNNNLRDFVSIQPTTTRTDVNTSITSSLAMKSKIRAQSTSSIDDRPNRPNKQPLLDILQLANVTIAPDSDEWTSLPSWDQVTARFGTKPRILGLETCDAYRRQVPPHQRMVGPSGMFSTGTNLLFQLLSQNCQVRPQPQPNDNTTSSNNYPKKIKSLRILRLRNKGALWQVNWGKHQYRRFRLENKVKDDIDNSQIFPVVMVRDPWTWFQSMCKVRYSAHWFHVPDHCPNFIPNHVEEEWFNKSKTFAKEYFHNDIWKVDNVMDKANFTPGLSRVVPVRIKFKSKDIYQDSLAHFWKSWYEEYYLESGKNVLAATAEAATTMDPPEDLAISSYNISSSYFPRLMIRLEDLVFFPQIILSTICDCVGGTLFHDPLLLTGETSKRGDERIHGNNKTDLLFAMISHVYTNRSKGMTREDIEYASGVLKDSPVLKAMGYPSHPIN